MFTSSTDWAWDWVLRILAGEDWSAEVVKKRFSTTKRIDSTAKSPKTSIKEDIKSRHEFLMVLDL